MDLQIIRAMAVLEQYMTSEDNYGAGQIDLATLIAWTKVRADILACESENTAQTELSEEKA